MNMATAIDPPATPGNAESEAALCAAMMVENRVIDAVADLVSAEDFSDKFFGHVYSVALREHALGRAVNPPTLRPYFDESGFQVLAGLTGGNVSVVGARDFARQVADLGKRRRLIAGFQDVITDAVKSEIPLECLVESADTAMSQALQRAAAVPTLTLAQAFDRTLQEIEDEAAGLGPQGVRIMGLEDFNELTGGLYRGDLMYLGGRPSMGKTALAIRVALGAAAAGNGASLISLEMKTGQLTTRAISDLIFEYGNCATFEAVRRGRFSAFDRERVQEARARIASWPLIITDPPSLNIGRLAMEIRRQRRAMAAAGSILDVVIIDYLGLIKGMDRKAKRFEEIGEISRTLKMIAKECDVALVVLAQLNRECERRDDKRPMLSDLRDAGDIEQDADHVMFVYRDEYYLERSEPEAHDKKRADWEIAMGHARDRIELITAKARNGRISKRTCYFFAQHQAVRGSDFMRVNR